MLLVAALLILVVEPRPLRTTTLAANPHAKNAFKPLISLSPPTNFPKTSNTSFPCFPLTMAQNGTLEVFSSNALSKVPPIPLLCRLSVCSPPTRATMRGIPSQMRVGTLGDKKDRPIPTNPNPHRPGWRVIRSMPRTSISPEFPGIRHLDLESVKSNGHRTFHCLSLLSSSVVVLEFACTAAVFSSSPPSFVTATIFIFIVPSPTYSTGICTLGAV
mmetsp:Transcript_7785/g.14677  ORF Transcript_7785/g.14677 Transcript_7785/m.14677 type:complete len:216 (-) Transcript_7785:2753-3400(-)